MYEKRQNKIVAILYFSIAFIALVFSIILFVSITDNAGLQRYPWKETYGGDAYTGMQNGIVDVAYNVNYMALDLFEAITTSMGFALLIISFIFVVFGIKCFFPAKYVKIEETVSAEEKAK
ncbi:MAG: hypothetical protein IKJ14_05065 [Clostridia bacterium]|nr:hypothetical protein [Clostridia bacterium]